MAIKPIDANPGIELVRETAANAANSRYSQRPPARTPDAAAAAAGAQVNQTTQQSKAPEVERVRVAQSPNMRIHVDQDTGKTVVELVNTDGQVLRQVPSDQALEVAKAIGRFQGNFVDLKV